MTTIINPAPKLLRKVQLFAGEVEDPNDLPSVAARIGIELRNQYVLAYSPKNQTLDGKHRKVEVKVADPGASPRSRYAGVWDTTLRRSSVA